MFNAIKIGIKLWILRMMFTPAQSVRVLVARGFRFTRVQRYYVISKVFDEKVYYKRERKEVLGVGRTLIRQCVEWKV